METTIEEMKEAEEKRKIEEREIFTIQSGAKILRFALENDLKYLKFVQLCFRPKFGLIFNDLIFRSKALIFVKKNLDEISKTRDFTLLVKRHSDVLEEEGIKREVSSESSEEETEVAEAGDTQEVCDGGGRNKVRRLRSGRKLK